MSATDKEYQRAADWAKEEMTLKPASTNALRGKDATAFGRDLLERATGGRPSIDPNARAGQLAGPPSTPAGRGERAARRPRGGAAPPAE